MCREVKRVSHGRALSSAGGEWNVKPPDSEEAPGLAERRLGIARLAYLQLAHA